MKNKLTIGNLYNTSGYFFLYPDLEIATNVFWDKDTRHIEYYCTSADRNCLHSQIVWSAYLLTKDLNCNVDFIKPDSAIMVLDYSSNYLYLKVLIENKIGWLIYLEEHLEELCLK